jgi:nicotinamide mononucleotide transporter
MLDLADWLAARGTSPLEVAGVGTGVLNVWLTVQERLVAWPVGVLNALLYLVVFARAGLYADTGLQLVYAALSVYGWWHWWRGGPDHTPLRVTRVGHAELAVAGVAGVVAWGALTAVTQRLPGAVLPAVDAALVAGSLVAQWLMTRKRLECWLLWLVVNAGYVALFHARGLALTAGLYALFWLLAVVGLRRWRRHLVAVPA